MSGHDNHVEQSDQSIDAKQTNICHPPSLPAEPLVSRAHMQDVFSLSKTGHLDIYDLFCSIMYIHSSATITFQEFPG